MKRVLKYLLILIGIIVLIVAGAAAWIGLGGIPTYDPPTIPKVTIETDSAALELGQKLTMTLCAPCHMGSDKRLTGGLQEDQAAFGTIYSLNITQDPETGIGAWTDSELAYYLRTGLRKDGSFSPPYMPPHVNMADKDLHAIIAFLRSDHPLVEPTRKEHPEQDLSFLAKFLSRVAFKPLPHPQGPISIPDPADKVAYGHYLTLHRYECFGCHSRDFSEVNLIEPEKSGGFMSGGNTFTMPDGSVVKSSNLTPDDETGIGTWTEDDFIAAVKWGKGKDGEPLRPPMMPFTLIDSSELAAMYAYIRTLEPVQNPME